MAGIFDRFSRGVSDRHDGGLGIALDTLFQAASISKPVTALAVLHYLATQGSGGQCV